MVAAVLIADLDEPGAGFRMISRNPGAECVMQRIAVCVLPAQRTVDSLGMTGKRLSGADRQVARLAVERISS